MNQFLKLFWKGFALMAVTALMGIGTASAADRCVGGLAAPCGTNYGTIQEAVDAATSGDTIHIFDGTYSENVTVEDKSIDFQKHISAAGDVIIDSGYTWMFYANTTFVNSSVYGIYFDSALEAQAITGDIFLDMHDSEVNGDTQFTPSGSFSYYLLFDNTQISADNFDIDLGVAGTFDATNGTNFLTDGYYNIENGASVYVAGADIFTGMYLVEIGSSIEFDTNTFHGPISNGALTIQATTGLDTFSFDNNIFEQNYVASSDIIGIIASTITSASISGNQFATDVSAPNSLLNLVIVATANLNFEDNTVLPGSHFDDILAINGPGTFTINNNTFLNEDILGNTGFVSIGATSTVFFTNNDFLISESTTPREFPITSESFTITGNNMPKVAMSGYAVSLQDNVLASYDITGPSATAPDIENNTFTSFGIDPDLAEYTLHLANASGGLNLKNNIILDADTNIFGGTPGGDTTAIIDIPEQGGDYYYYNNTIISNSDSKAALNLGGTITDDTYFKNNVFVNNGSAFTDVIETGPDFVSCGVDASANLRYEHNLNSGGFGPNLNDCAITYGADGPLSSTHINYATDPDNTAGTNDYFVSLYEGTLASINPQYVTDSVGTLTPDAFVGKLLKLFAATNDMEYYYYIESNDEDEIFIMDDNLDITEPNFLYGGIGSNYMIVDPEDIGEDSILIDSGISNDDDSEVPTTDKLGNARVEGTDRGAIEKTTVAGPNTAPVISNPNFNTDTNTLSWDYSDTDSDGQIAFTLVLNDGTSFTVTPDGLSVAPEADEYKIFTNNPSFDFLDLDDELMLEPNTAYTGTLAVYDEHDLISNTLPVSFSSGFEIEALPTPDYYQTDLNTHVFNFNTPSGFDETTELALVINQDTNINYPVDPEYVTCVDPGTLTLSACNFDDLASIPRDTIANWGEDFVATIPYVAGTYYIHAIGFENGTDTLTYAMTASETMKVRGIRLTDSEYSLATSYSTIDITEEEPTPLYVECRHEYYLNGLIDNINTTLTSTLGDSETLAVVDELASDSYLRGTINAVVATSAIIGNGILEVADNNVIGLNCDIDETGVTGAVDNFESYVDTDDLTTLWSEFDFITEDTITLETDNTQYLRNSIEIDDGISGPVRFGRLISETDYCDTDFKIDVKIDDLSLISSDPYFFIDVFVSDLVFALLDNDYDANYQVLSKDLLTEGEFVEVILDDVSNESLGGGIGFDCEQVQAIQLLAMVNNSTGGVENVTVEIDNIQTIEAFSISFANSVTTNDVTPDDNGGTGTNPPTDDTCKGDGCDVVDDPPTDDETCDDPNGCDEVEDPPIDDETCKGDGCDEVEDPTCEAFDSCKDDDEQEDEEECTEDCDTDDTKSHSKEDTFRSSGGNSGSDIVVRTERNTDSDGDGCADELEIRYGSNPNKANSIADGISDCDAIYLYDGQTDLSKDFITVNAGTYPDYEFVITGAVNFGEQSAYGSTVNFKVVDDDNFTINLGDANVQENNLYIKLNDIELADGTYTLIASTISPSGKALSSSDTLNIDSTKQTNLDILNFSGIEFSDNQPVKSKRDNVLEVGKKIFAYGKAPRDSSVRAYWNSVLLTSVSLSDTSEGSFYVEPREELSTDEIHTLILVAENSEDDSVKSKPLVIKFRVKDKVDFGAIAAMGGFGLLLILVIIFVISRLTRKRSTLETSLDQIDDNQMQTIESGTIQSQETKSINLDGFIN